MAACPHSLGELKLKDIERERNEKISILKWNNKNSSSTTMKNSRIKFQPWTVPVPAKQNPNVQQW